MQHHFKCFVSFICLLTAASTLLSSVAWSFESCPCAVTSDVQAGLSESVPLAPVQCTSAKKCCVVINGEGRPCCCEPVPVRSSNSGPQGTCDLCPCSAPLDAVPPPVLATSVDHFYAMNHSLASFDGWAASVDSQHGLASQHSPATSNLVISLSRLTC